jgi:hypothetical protein
VARTQESVVDCVLVERDWKEEGSNSVDAARDTNSTINRGFSVVVHGQ